MSNAPTYAFQRTLETVIRSRRESFDTQLERHIGEFSLANRINSGADASERLRIARAVVHESISGVMESAIKYSQTEGVPVKTLGAVIRNQFRPFIQHVEKLTMSIAGDLFTNAPGESFTALMHLETEFNEALDHAIKDAMAGRVGFERHAPLPFWRAARKKLRDDPWLLLSHAGALAVGLLLGYAFTP